MDHLLPACCIVCGLPAASPGICEGCRHGLPWSSSACPVCGLPVPDVGPVACGRCLYRPPPLDAVAGAFWYEFPVRELIHRYKFHRDMAAGGVLAALWAMRAGPTTGSIPDYLVPVPLHGWRLLRRGFNQAYDLARLIGRARGVALLPRGLRRTLPTPHQAGLDAAARRRNLDGAFRWRGRPLEGEHLALVDDVMTTGATLRECARTLKRAGAGRVDAWVLARAIM
jgi:ComF family protein